MKKGKFAKFLQKNPTICGFMMDVTHDVDSASIVFNRLVHLSKPKPFLSSAVKEGLSIVSLVATTFSSNIINGILAYFVVDMAGDIVNVGLTPSKEKEAIDTLKKTASFYNLADDKEAELAKIREEGFVDYSMRVAAKCSIKI